MSSTNHYPQESDTLKRTATGKAYNSFNGENDKRWFASSAEIATQGSAAPVTLTWKNISYSVAEKKKKENASFPSSLFKEKVDKQILKNINGIVKPGELCAIMGSSGAGKSTLLDVLCGRKNSSKSNLTGDVLVNGKPADKYFKRISAYVTQDDCLEGTETVSEALNFHANLRLPNSTYSKQDKQLKINKVIDELGLEKVRNSLIGTQFKRGISGGEKKRVSIATELLTDPSLLFLDEPTTGLDSFNAITVMEKLSKLAKQSNKTVICTLHQPRTAIFSLCDKLMILSKGEVVYFGPGNEALAYFKDVLGYSCPPNVNPADFFIDVTIKTEREQEAMASPLDANFDDIEAGLITKAANKNNSELLSTKFVASERYKLENQQIDAHIQKAISISTNETYELTNSKSNLSDSEYATNWFIRTYYVTGRFLRHFARSPMISYIKLFQSLFMAFLVSSIYWQVTNDQSGIQDRVGCLFFILLSQGFGQMSSLNDLLIGRNLFNRERAAGVYSTSAYYVGKFISDLPMQIILPVVFSCICYYAIGFQNDIEKFGIFVGTMTLFSLVAGSFFMFIGSLSPSQPAATILAPLSMVLLMLFGGFYINLNSIPVYFKWVYYISWIRYGYEIVVTNEFTGLSFTCTESQKRGGFCPIQKGSQELELLGMENVNMLQNAIILASMYVVFHTFAYIASRFLYKEKR